MPTAAEKPMPMANDHHGSEMGKPDAQWTSKPMPLPEGFVVIGSRNSRPRAAAPTKDGRSIRESQSDR